MLLQDDPLVDVFVFLCRTMLDALEITNRRFNVLVQKRTKSVCLREIDVAYLVADAAVARMPVSSRLVTAPARHRDGGLQSETFTIDDATTDDICRWFVNRLRHSVVLGRLELATTTDSPDFVESVKGTVLLKKGLWWSVGQAIDIHNAFKFLSTFAGHDEVKLSVEEESFRFTDDWFKLFESLALYRVTLYETACTASTQALISFLFGASSAPGSEKRVLQATFEWTDTETLKAVVKQLVEAAMSCLMTHRTTFLMDDLDWDDVITLTSLPVKYKNALHDNKDENGHAEDEELDEGNGSSHERIPTLKFSYRLRAPLEVFNYDAHASKMSKTAFGLKHT